VLVECDEVAGDDDVGKGHTLADQEGLVKEVVVQDLKSKKNFIIYLELDGIMNCDYMNQNFDNFKYIEKSDKTDTTFPF
jgi:hypothetical protein